MEKLERASNAGDQALVDSLFAKYDRTIPSFRERIQSMVVEEPEPAAKESSFELKKKEFTPKPIEAVRSKGAAAAPARAALQLEPRSRPQRIAQSRHAQRVQRTRWF